MNEAGKIDREVVIAVLRVSGVEVHGLDDGPSDMLVLSKGKRIEGQRLPLMVERKMLLYLSRQYGIPIERFYDKKMGSSDTQR